MKNISFALTTKQFLDGSKTITRRLGWKNLKVGTVLCAVEKAQGLKKGEHVKKLGRLRVLAVNREALNAILDYDEGGCGEVCAEGFGQLSPGEFIEMFCQHNHCAPTTFITRIAFEKL